MNTQRVCEKCTGSGEKSPRHHVRGFWGLESRAIKSLLCNSIYMLREMGGSCAPGAAP
jgi:hypothetical protein